MVFCNEDLLLRVIFLKGLSGPVLTVPSQQLESLNVCHIFLDKILFEVYTDLLAVHFRINKSSFLSLDPQTLGPKLPRSKGLGPRGCRVVT